MPSVHVLDNAISGALLTRLRDRDTGTAAFRAAARELGSQLATRAADLLDHHVGTVQTPLGPAASVEVSHPVVVPVLRAGLGLLPGVLDVFSESVVGMIGMARNEETLVAEQYYRNVPNLAGQDVLVLEPMLATGGSAADALNLLPGARSRLLLSVVATQAAIDRIVAAHPDVTVLTGAIDPSLNELGWIVPGLGDFGDRLWGTL